MCIYMCRVFDDEVVFPLTRLEGVEARLQESSEAFEKSRDVAKKSKMEYEKVKKERSENFQQLTSSLHAMITLGLFILCCCRYNRFQDAFEHVSTIIDDIYKVRTHWISFRLINTYFLSV